MRKLVLNDDWIDAQAFMQTWADYLDELKAGQGRKVLPFTVNE